MNDNFNPGNPLQGTADWLSERTGSLTASRMADAMDFRKDGKPGAARVKLIKEILAERMTGSAMPHFVSDAMERGKEEEPAAREAYEAATGNLVQLVGFIAHPTIPYLGASPDGKIDGDGLVEIKNPTTAVHLTYVLGGAVPVEYKPQMIVQLLCTRRRWCDFVSFDGRIKEAKRRLFVRRFEPRPEEFAEVESAAVAFLREVELLWEALHTEAA